MEEVKVDYTEFESLENNFIKCSNVQQIFDAIEAEISSYSQNWRKDFETMNNLRKLNKFFTQNEIIPVIMSYLKLIISCINSIRSNLIKNALLLLSELFQNKKLVWESSFYFSILPIVYDKIISEKAFIKIEVKKVIKNLEDNYFNEEILSIVSKLCGDKNFHIAEFSGSSYINLLKNNIEEIKKDDKVILKSMEILLVLIKIRDKRSSFGKYFNEILTMMINNLKEEKLNEIVNSMFQEKEKECILEHIGKIKKSDKKDESVKNFKDFIKNKKNSDSKSLLKIAENNTEIKSKESTEK